MGILKFQVIMELNILVHYELYIYYHYYQITMNYLLSFLYAYASWIWASQKVKPFLNPVSWPYWGFASFLEQKRN